MKKYKFLSLLLILIVLLSACGSSNKSSIFPRDEYTNYPDYAEAPMETAPELSEETFDVETNVLENRKVIISYSLNIETKDYDNSIKSINELIKSYKGVATSIQEDNYNTRYVIMSVQIPSETAAEFVEDLNKIDTLLIRDRNLNSEDITDKYTDTELRLKILREKLDRLNSLQSNQSDLESLLALESEISDTILEIERIEGSIRAMDSKVNYTDVQISLQEISSVPYSETRAPFGDRVATAFTQSIDNFINGLQSFIIGLIYIIPELVLLLIIIGVVFLIARPIYRKFIKNRVPKKKAGSKIRRTYNNNSDKTTIEEIKDPENNE